MCLVRSFIHLDFTLTPAMQLERFPKLLGDIGGTNVRLALKLSPQSEISHILNLTLRDHAGAVEAIEHYLAQVGASSGAMSMSNDRRLPAR